MRRLQRFYALEGIDGAGTTTQARMLEARFGAEGIDSFVTAEPTQGAIGKLIRRVLSGDIGLTARTVAALFVADRTEHLEAPVDGILARLDAGAVVVTDRYLFSSLAYQSVECGFDFVRDLNSRFPLPEAVFSLEVSTETAMKRSETRPLREIYEHRSFQDRVVDRYRAAYAWAEEAGVAVYRFDGTETPEAIHAKIWNIVTGRPIE
jgi:dTMP kinase